MEKIAIKVKVSVNNLFEFMMYSNYCSFRGVASVLFSVLCFVGTIHYWNSIANIQKALMIFMALMFTVIAPIEYYIRAKRQVKKGFLEELTYTFDENGITISRGEENSKLEWTAIIKVNNTKNLVMIYFSPIRAFILPKKNIGDQFDSLKELIKSNTSCYKFKMER